jgi:uncharacterized protein (DUF433 family)
VRTYVAQAVARALAKDVTKSAPGVIWPQIVSRDGVAFVKGTSLPVRRLWRAIRAGSTAADIRAAFPHLPPGALKTVVRFAQANPRFVAKWKPLLAPAQTTPGEEDDNGKGFDAELEDLLTSRAELFRRLAR